MSSVYLFFFFFNDTATTEIYTLSLHDALPICADRNAARSRGVPRRRCACCRTTSTRRWPSVPTTWWSTEAPARPRATRSEEHTSELQSRQYLVCRLLLEKKKKDNITA